MEYKQLDKPEKYLKCNNFLNFEVNLMKHMKKKKRPDNLFLRDNSAQLRKTSEEQENIFENDLEVFEECQEYDSDLDSDSKKCM